MQVPSYILLKPWPQPKSPPLLETVFRVLKSVATGSNSSGQGSTIRSSDADPDAIVDNIGEHLTTLSPPHSPLSSPTKEAFNQRSPNFKTPPAPGESESNIRSVRLAARMVTRFFFLRSSSSVDVLPLHR